MKRGIKKETIEHYDRMITWAEKQPHDTMPMTLLMLHDIGESWDSRYCYYCDIFLFNPEKTCPLNLMYTYCRGKNCCGALWSVMQQAPTWGTWIVAAKKVRAFIKKTPLNKGRTL